MREYRLTEPCSFQTPAKVNLHLYVQGKRPDGYHDLELDLVPISLFDQIELLPFPDEGFWFLCEPELCPPEENLVVRAVRRLEQKIGAQFSFALKLTKHIPSGAGLGGGSGNAAGILSVLNQVFTLELAPSLLQELALELGADVPFFLDPKPQRATGVGAEFADLDGLTPWHLLLVKPELHISTAQAYKACEHSRRSLPPGPYNPKVIEQISTKNNDFFAPLSTQFPELINIRDHLKATDPVAVQFSGSGSVLYGIYATEEQRDKARDQFQGTGETYPAQMLLSHRYLPPPLEGIQRGLV